jgi:hypothetical protein
MDVVTTFSNPSGLNDSGAQRVIRIDPSGNLGHPAAAS